MNTTIFRSRIWLKLKNISDENLYHESRRNSLKYWLYALPVICLLSAIMNLCIQLNYVKPHINFIAFPFPEIILMAYISLGLNILFTILIISMRNIKARQYLYYAQFLSIELAFFSLHFSVSVYALDPHNKYSLHGVESLIKILNFVVFLEFIDSIVVTVISIGWGVPLYAFFKSWDMCGFMYTYTLFNVSFVCIAYFIVLERKTSFFYSKDSLKKKDWFQNIIENMKSGFIHVKDSKIKLINQNMEDIMKKNTQINKMMSDFKESSGENGPEFFDSQENSKRVLQELLDGLNGQLIDEVDYEPECSKRIIIIPVANSNDFKYNADENKSLSSPRIENSILFLEQFKKNKNCSNNNNKFTMVGIKTLPIGDDENHDEHLTIEVYCRYYLNPETKEDEFEIIFNDITKAKQNEEKKSEIKYKSLFLSKVAHEFKNPLICIIELVHQLSDNFKHIQEGEKDIIVKCEDNLHQINSFSHYLMILIRDFDYFSQKNFLMKKIPVEKEECDLKETLTFCNEIAGNLLKRNGKNKNILFEIEAKEDVPDKIITDENRLKQVLVNLISNAIKFTNKGKVLLKAYRQQSDLIFCVSDTGMGIDIKNKGNFFDPYNSCTKSNKVNPFGTGLGMSIIFDLTNALGKSIDFTSELNKGSNFFFSIPLFYNNKKFSSKSMDNIQKTLCERRNNPIQIFNQNLVIKNKYISNKSIANIIKIEQVDLGMSINHLNSTKIKTEELKLINSKSIETNNNKNSNENDINASYDFFIEMEERKHSSKMGTKNQTFFSPLPKFILKTNFSKKTSDNELIMDYNNTKKEDNDIKDGMELISKSRTAINKENWTEKNELFQAKTLQNFENSIKIDDKLKPSKCEILSDYIDQFILQFNLEEEKEFINILLVDDESLTRCSNKRLISKYAKSNNIKVNLIEAEDGFECLYILYACNKKGIKISCVISDQTMTYMNGSTTATVLKQMANSDTLCQTRFYIVTAYEDESTISKIKLASITNVFSKPMKKLSIQKIFEEIS